MPFYSSGSNSYRIVDELPDVGFWECSYCGSSNLSSTVKCCGCGATIKKVDRRNSGRSYVTYEDLRENVIDTAPKKKGLFGKLFGG